MNPWVFVRGVQNWSSLIVALLTDELLCRNSGSVRSVCSLPFVLRLLMPSTILELMPSRKAALRS